jgi:hypothetical protein
MRPIRFSSAAAVLAWLVAGAGFAHPDAGLDTARLVVHRFAIGIVNRDVDAVAETLASDGRFLGLTRAEFLAAGVKESDIDDVILSAATFEPVALGLRIEPIVGRADRGTFQVVWAATLAQRDGAWKLVALEPSVEVPQAFVPKNLPEQIVTTPVTFSLVDARTRAPVYARVHLEDRAGEYWPPRGHQKHIRVGWREDVGGDVRIAGDTYAYVPGEFTADLPRGRIAIEVEKGMEYAPARAAFDVGDEPQRREIALERLVDMNARGWYSGDTHVHFLDDHNALLEAEAEELNLINVLATRWGELVTNANQVTGAPSALSRPRRIVVFNEETRHGWLGHAILHRLRSLVYPLSWGGPSEGVPGEFDYPAMAHQADAAHAQGGVVTWAHFPVPGGEVAVDVALGKIDTVDLFTWGDAFAPLDAPTASGDAAAVDAWYRFLNVGFTLPVTAGTDKMLNVQVAGSVRTYARIDGPFGYDAWCDAIRAGRTFATTGPMLELSANGAPIGSTLPLAPGAPVEVVAEVRAPFERYPIEVLEIVAGGRVVAALRNGDRKSQLRLRHRFDATTSTWIAARARGSKLLPYQRWLPLGRQGAGIPPMAHTSPIHVTVDGAPMRSNADATALETAVDAAIGWAKTRARYRNEAERAEVVALFERAKRIYADLKKP